MLMRWSIHHCLIPEHDNYQCSSQSNRIKQKHAGWNLTVWRELGLIKYDGLFTSLKLKIRYTYLRIKYIRIEVGWNN